jgi:hypothetical protein
MARRGGRKAHGGRRANGGRKGGFWGTLASVGLPIVADLIGKIVSKRKGAGIRGGRRGGMWMGHDTRLKRATKPRFNKSAFNKMMRFTPQ